MFTAPLLGIVSGKLDWSTSTPTLSLATQRVDLGSSAAVLSVKVWGPKRVSPGQTVEYIIEYRNDGIKAAEQVRIAFGLSRFAEFVSAPSHSEVTYDKDSHTVTWQLDEKVAPKESDLLYVREKMKTGLPEGAPLINWASALPPPGTTYEEHPAFHLTAHAEPDND